jgi:Fe-S-cluster containining protein
MRLLVAAAHDDEGEAACCWWDEGTRGCQYYDYRPDICREFEVGGVSCFGWREEFGVVDTGAGKAGVYGRGVM